MVGWFIENTIPVFQILPMPAIEREAQAAETSHPKDLKILGNIINYLRNNMNISLHNKRLQQSKRLHYRYINIMQ